MPFFSPFCGCGVVWPCVLHIWLPRSRPKTAFTAYRSIALLCLYNFRIGPHCSCLGVRVDLVHNHKGISRDLGDRMESRASMDEYLLLPIAQGNFAPIRDYLSYLHHALTAGALACRLKGRFALVQCSLECCQ